MMQFRLTPHDSFVIATLDGLVSLSAWEAVLTAFQHAIEPLAVQCLVIDMRGVVGWLGTPERAAVGGLMAHCFAPLKRVAVVVQQEKISGIVESEGKRLGLDLRVLSDFDEAVQWVSAVG